MKAFYYSALIDCSGHKIQYKSVKIKSIGSSMAKKTLFINRHDEFTEGIPQTGPALISIHTVRSQMFPLEQHKLIHTLISKVVVFENKIQIHFKAMGF